MFFEVNKMLVTIRGDKGDMTVDIEKLLRE